MHTLLAYLVEKTLTEAEKPLKEYTIGVEAFGRPEGYDPQQDAYVRVQAGKLRQKLNEYYTGEGSSDPIHIELPKRQFLLEFQHRQPTETAAEPVVDRQRGGRRRLPDLLADLDPGLSRAARFREGAQAGGRAALGAHRG